MLNVRSGECKVVIGVSVNGPLDAVIVGDKLFVLSYEMITKYQISE